MPDSAREDMSERHAAAARLLEANGQNHVLAGWDQLDDGSRNSLLDQIDAIPWSVLAQERQLLSTEDQVPKVQHDFHSPVVIEPDSEQRAAYRAAGEEWIAAGRIAAFTVAGGQGTRLGWNGPKGTYPATPVSGKPLFACFAEQLLAVERRYGVVVPWYILTSPENDGATRNFLLDNKCFGLERNNIMLCMQGTMPVFDVEHGRLLMTGPGRIATSPDGHGGSLDALANSGALADMAVRGAELISYTQVDNPLATLIDPVFIGLHADQRHSSEQVSSKVVEKTDPAERVGVFAQHGNSTTVIEYSDLSSEQAAARTHDGRLQFNAGNIAIHLFSRSFVEEIVGAGGAGLPWHRAVKAMPVWDATAGHLVEPQQPNAVKMERFIFDVLARADRPAILRVERDEEFAPIKNAAGNDSPETSSRLQSDLHGGWLESCGVEIPRDAQGHVDALVEIGPLTALVREDLQQMDLPSRVERGDSFLL